MAFLLTNTIKVLRRNTKRSAGITVRFFNQILLGRGNYRITSNHGLHPWLRHGAQVFIVRSPPRRAGISGLVDIDIEKLMCLPIDREVAKP